MRQELALPLDHLASVLLRLACPPHLGTLMELMEGEAGYFDFLALVREFLPERAAQILEEPHPTGQVLRFAERFGSRYFPLDISEDIEIADDYSYGDLLQCIPVTLGGIAYESLHDPRSVSDCLRLIVALVSFEGIDDRDGLRTLWLEGCQDVVPMEDLTRIPQEGYSLQRLHALLDGTWFEPVAMVAEMVGSTTGTYYLDLEYDNEVLFEWDRETVAQLTQEWLRADMIMNRVTELLDWLEADRGPRFRALLDFIEENGEAYDHH